MSKANSYVQAEVDGLKSEVNSVIADLDCAEVCETHQDLIANLESALESLAHAKDAIKAALRDAKTLGPDTDED